MEIKKQQIGNDCISIVGSKSAEVTCRIDTADRGGAKRILSVTATPSISQVETVAGQARVEGKVSYKLLYLDAEDHLAGLEYYCDLQTIVEDERIDASRATATSYVADEHAKIHEDVITLDATVDIDVMQLLGKGGDAIAEADCECKEATITLGRITPIGEEKFDVADEIETGESIDRILLFDARVGMDDLKSTPSGSTLAGNVIADIVYLADGAVKSRTITIPFAEEIQADGDIAGTLAVKSSRIVISGEENNSIIRVETVLSYSGYRYEGEQVTVIEDMYAEGENLDVRRETIVCNRPAGRYHLRHKLHVETPLGEETGNLDKVFAALPCRLGLANLVPDEDSVTLEGLAVVSVLGEGDGIVAATVELPFSAPFGAVGVTSKDLIKGQAIIEGVEAAVKGGMLDVTVTFGAMIERYEPTAIDYIAEVQATPKEDGDQAAISVYFPTHGETLWDVARAVGVSPSVLAEHNPNWQDDPRRVIVFRHKAL